MKERPPTSSVDAELFRHMMPPVRVFTSHTESSTVTVARTTGESEAVSPPCGFTLEILRWPKNATGQPFVSAAVANTRLESAEVNSRISIPLCAASTYSSKRCVANWWRLPLAFSTENSNSPILRCGTRLRLGGSSTRWRTGRCPPPQPKLDRTMRKHVATPTARISTPSYGDSEHQHNACQSSDGNLDHISRTSSAGRCLSARPSLRRNDTWYRLSADVGDDLPDGARRHHAAIRRHPARPAVKDGLKQRA